MIITRIDGGKGVRHYRVEGYTPFCCQEHAIKFKRYEKQRQVRYSQRVANGK